MKRLIKIVPLVFIFIYGCSNGDDNNKIEASGNIEATNVTVSAKSNGEILKILKDEGDFVKEGDTVLIIDHENSGLLLRQAEAAMNAVEAQYNLLKNGSRKEDINYTEEMLKQAEINYKNAENDKKRFESLYKLNTITSKQYEDAAAKFEMAQAQYNAARENFTKIKNIARPEELKQAEANVEKSRAAADILRKSIKDSYVTAPVSGIISRKYFERGETVNQMSALFKIAELRSVDLVIYVSEQELGKVKQGQNADIRIDTFPEKIYKGKVTYISPEAEFTPKNIQTKDERTKLVFAVKIKVDNPEFELKPGMPADAVVNIK
jgi:HlyD family secretion protein